MSKYVPMIHRTSKDVATIFVEFNNEDPLDLLEFTASLTALAREHETLRRTERKGTEVDESRLLVLDVRKGSIILELLPALIPIISDIEVTNSAVTFVKHMRDLFTSLSRKNGRIDGATTQQLKNTSDAVQAIANDSKGRLRLAARYTDGTVLQEFVIEKDDARTISANATAQRREITDKGAAQYSGVLMRLHQSSVSNLSIGKRTSEKGIVERIDLVPRTLIYASDLAGRRIKQEIQNPQGNPYSKGFVVDLDVETVGGKPKIYRILDVLDVLDLDDD